MSTAVKSTFTPKEVVKIVGISYRQIQYWDKTGFIRPSYRSHGKYRQYTFADLVQLKVAKLLRDHEVSIQKLRKIIKSLRDLFPKISFPLGECNLLIEGGRILVFEGDVLMDAATGGDFVRFDARTLRAQIDQAHPDDESETSAARSAIG
ncbi:MAG: MerR family transcriptional regulator [Candidatus Riflebacteria bacterium]|nr:MerR family transcriptional regulator [Candidatus Riflebacteria bacterium]